MKTIITFLAAILIAINGFGQIEFKGYIVNEKGKKLNNVAVSYTHLTLPTIYSV